MLKVKVTVTLKEGLLDPQGKTILASLPGLGIENVSEVRTGKHFNLSFDGTSREEAAATTEELCHRLLSNPVIENYSYEIAEEQPAE